MPYPNIDPADTETIAKMDSCVEKVQASGKDKDAAIAICYSQIVKGKALNNSIRNLIESKIHRAYTIVCDELLMRGYLNHDERMEIGGLIGDLLSGFGKKIDPLVAERVVQAEDVESMIEDKEIKQPKNILEAFMDGLSNLIESVKAGARHNSKDSADVQDIHDKAVGLGAQCIGKMSVSKQADGKLRWTSISSTAYRDRDGEIISAQALADDVARADATQEYGPLRFWHIPGVDLGDCDYNALDGRVLIESGTFRDEAIGEAVKAASENDGISLGFYHPATEPDAQGVYHNIRRFERSILPAHKASNLFTQLSVKESNMANIEPEKLAALEKLVGKDKAAELLAQAQAVQKAADAAGVAFKQTADKPADTPAAQTPTPKKNIGELFKEMDEDAYMAYMQKCMEPMVTKAIQAALGAKKEASDEAAQKEAAEKAQADKLAALEASISETTKAQTALTEILQASQKAQAQILTDLAELKGEMPNAAKGYRASQQGPAPVGALKGAQPMPDDSFAKFLTGQS